MKKEIFDSLAKLSPSLSVSTNTPKLSPAAEIPGDLAFCLDILMNTIGEKINLGPAAVLEKILDVGIDNWISQLPDTAKRQMGLIGGAAPRSSFDAEEDENDPDPAHAQQAAYAQMTESYGYTPLTAHSVNAKGGNGKGRNDSRGGGSNGRRNTKKKNVRAAGKKHAPQRNSSRRRKFSTSKSHSTQQ